MLTVLGGLAEFERELIRARTVWRELLTIYPLDLLGEYKPATRHIFERPSQKRVFCLRGALFGFCRFLSDISARNDMQCEHGRRCSGSAK